MDHYDLDGAPSVDLQEDADDQRKIRGAILSDEIRHVKRAPLVTVAPSTSIATTIDAMNNHHVGCALVLDEGQVQGIFTERDVLRKVVGKVADLAATPIAAVMTRDPSTLPESALVAFALRKMVEEGYRHIPLVADDGGKRAVGVVAVRDIVAWIVALLPEAVTTLPPEPTLPPPRL
jgi:CBS domain-containing protein